MAAQGSDQGLTLPVATIIVRKRDRGSLNRGCVLTQQNDLNFIVVNT